MAAADELVAHLGRPADVTEHDEVAVVHVLAIDEAGVVRRGLTTPAAGLDL
jgi:hypothetical protein